MNSSKMKGKVMQGIGRPRLPKRNVAIGVFLLFLILLTFLPRLFSLSAHWATDEDLWMQRSLDFFFALKSGQFEDTFVAHHPGVTTCWLGSLAIWFTAQQGYFKGGSTLISISHQKCLRGSDSRLPLQPGYLSFWQVSFSIACSETCCLQA